MKDQNTDQHNKIKPRNFTSQLEEANWTTQKTLHTIKKVKDSIKDNFIASNQIENQKIINLENIWRVFFDVDIIKYTKKLRPSIKKYRKNITLKRNDLLVSKNEYTHFDWKIFHVYNIWSWEEIWTR